MYGWHALRAIAFLHDTNRRLPCLAVQPAPLHREGRLVVRQHILSLRPPVRIQQRAPRRAVGFASTVQQYHIHMVRGPVPLTAGWLGACPGVDLYGSVIYGSSIYDYRRVGGMGASHLVCALPIASHQPTAQQPTGTADGQTDRQQPDSSQPLAGKWEKGHDKSREKKMERKKCEKNKK